MNSSPDCPVCASRQWVTIGRKTWNRADLPSLDPVLQKRLRVLYEVWCPGSNEFSATSELCQACGFVIYSPRPTAAEIDAKYRFLTELGPDEAIPSLESEFNQIRTASLFQVLAKHLPQPTGNRLLDFGGGDGRLLKHFIERGDQGFVIDYVRETLPGVAKLGDTLNDLDPQTRFDGIVCSHVLEHVAEPFAVLTQLVKHLAPEGRIFIEVPMEIWKRPPLQPDPVTHVNFFTEHSLRAMLVRAGLQVDLCRTEGIKLPGSMNIVVRGIAKLTAKPSPMPTGGADDVRKLLNPSLVTKLWWTTLHPGILRQAIKAKFQRFFL